jgi:hypothetical protein
MIAVAVGCMIAIIILGVIIIFASAVDEEIAITLFGVMLSSFGVIGLLGFRELIDNNNSQYIPAEPLAHNQTQTVFTTDEGTYIANGLYPDGTYLLTVDGKDVLVVWQAVDGEAG